MRRKLASISLGKLRFTPGFNHTIRQFCALVSALVLFQIAVFAHASGAFSTETTPPPGWTINPANFQFNKSLVIRARYNNVPTNDPANIVGVFVGTELRGVATPTNVGGQMYFFVTAYSNNFCGEVLNFRTYYAPDDQVYPVMEKDTFCHNGTHGTLAQPFWLNIDPNADFPPFIGPVPADTTMRTIPFDPLNLANYSGSPDGDPVTWTAQAGVNLTASIVNGMLTVTPVSPTWVGTDTIRITITESTANHYAASFTASYTVLPFYPAPDFSAIPPQSAFLGGTFNPFDLDNFLTYSGPCRAFGFMSRPYTGTAANPGWAAVPPGAQSMSVIVRPLFGEKTLAGAGAELAAFVNNILVGKASPSGTAPNIYYSLTLANLASGPITFRFYHAANQYLYEVTTTLNFVPGGSAGSIGTPYSLQLAPLVPSLANDGTVQVTIADTTWQGTLPIDFYVWDCAYPLTRRDSVTALFTVAVNNNPEIVSPTSVNFKENTCFELYDAQTIDRNNTEGSGLTYALAGGQDASKFSVNATNGKLSWLNFTPDFEIPGDFNADNHYEVKIKVTNALNLSDTVALTVNVTDNTYETFDPQINNGGQVCFTGSIVLQATGGGTYLWNTSAITPSITVSTSGSYTVTVTNVYACTASVTAVVNAKPSITAAGSSTPVCAGSLVNLSSTPTGGSGVYATFSWTGPNNYVAMVEDPPGFPALPNVAGTYTVTVTDDKGCTASATTTITVSGSSAPSITATGTTPVCEGTPVTLTSTPSGGSGTYSMFKWGGPNGYAATVQNPPAFTATQNSSGSYTVTLTDNAGCTATATKVIQVNSKPTVTASSNTPVCTGSTIMLNASPSGGTAPYTNFAWSGPNNFTAFVEDTTIFPAIAAASGTYRVTVTDNNGCTGTATTVVAVKLLPSITATISGATCQGGTLKLNSTPSGGTTPYATFSWTGPNNFSSPLEDPAAIPLIPAAAGPYTVTVTDAAGCTATSSVTATINTLPAIVAANSGPVCAGSQLLLSSTPSGGTAPYTTYSWAGPANYSATVEDPAGFTASNNSGGAYTVTVTDSKGCTASASTTAAVNLKPTITAANNGPFCIGATLNLTSTPAGGSGTYLTFNWTGPNSYTAAVEDPAPFSVTLAASGIYRVTVTDSQGCTGTASTTVSVSANSLPSITAASNSPICTATNLALSSTPSGGSGVYSAFSWAGPNSYTANVEDPAPFMASSGNSGVYTVTVTDNKGCTGSGTVTVAVNGPTVNMSKTDLSCFGSNNGTATVSSTGGAPPYSYSWSTGANSATITGLAAGTYTVTLTSSSSGACTAVGMVTISQPAALTASIQQTTPACSNQPSGSALAQGSGGASPFTFKWPASAGNQMTALATGLAAGNYTVTVTDASNCSATATAVITTGTGVTVNSIANIGPACPAGNIALIALSCTPPNSSVNYTWSGGVPAGLSNGTSTGSNPSIPAFTASLTEGVYTVTVTATLGACSSTRTFNVQIDDATLPVLNNCPQNVTLNNTAGQCSAVHTWQTPTATDNCGNVTVNQTAGPASGTTFNVGTSQTVVYTANDNGGNSATCSFTITVNDTQKPTLNCPTSQNFGTDITHCYYTNTGNTLNATATDNCGLKPGAAGLSYNATGASTSTGTTLNGVVFQPGTTTVIWTATDQYNNSATCAYTVVVLDDDAPQIITCPQNQTVSTASNGTGDCTGKIPNLLTALAVSDNCTANNALVITQSPAANATFAGQHGTQQLVTFTVKDAANNSNFCSALLTLADTEAPVYVNCPNQITLNNDVDKCGANIFFTAPSATDNCSGVIAVSQVAGPVPGTYLPVGQIQTINYSALDGAGNTSTCQTTIQVVDSQKPTLFCPGGVQTFSTNNGACSYLAGSALNATATDNCSVSSVVNSFNNTNTLSGASFSIGTTVVTWTATDPAGNTRSCSYSVVVADEVLPVISSCPLSRNVFTNSNGAGDCTGAVPNMVNELFATDNCTNNAGLVVTQSPVAGSLFGAQHNDTRIVTFTVKDAAGNISNCQNVLTIKDNESPVFQTCPTTTQVYETDPNQCSAKVNWAIPSAQDNCGGVTVVQTAGPSQGTSLSVGPLHTVTYLATDAPGNTGTCQFSIRVVDGQKPTLFCPGGIQTIGTNTGCTYVATATLNISATDNCSNSTLTNTFNNSNSLVGAAFPIGSTLVTWTATDASGNSQTCSYTVVITDDDFPTITTCPPSRNVNSNGNGTGDCTGVVPNMLPELVATDNCSAPGTLEITQSQVPGSTFGAQHNDTRVVTFTVTDAGGNSSTCQATLTLKDNEPPVFQTCPTTTLVFETDPDQCSAKVNWIIPSAQDNCGSSTVLQVAGPILGASLTVGPLHSVTYQATDAAGNSSTCSFSIRILDGQKPTLFCPGGIQSIGTNTNNCTYIADATLNIAASDNCSIANLTNTFNNSNTLSGAAFPVGSTLVTWTATDASGNSQTCSYTVVVRDDDNPSISTCPPSRNVNSNSNAGGDCTGLIPGMVAELLATDNCTPPANLVVTQNQAPGTTFGAQHNDTRVVTFTVTDAGGNSSTCQATLTLKDNEPPVFQTCPTTTLVFETDPDQCSAKVNWIIPSAQDNCGSSTVTQTAGPVLGTSLTVGPLHSVTYQATDAAGNSSTCSFSMRVLDGQKPTLFCPGGNQTFGTNNGNCSYQATSVLNIAATDNCSISTLTNTFNNSNSLTNAVFPQGTTLVTWTATDASNNTQTCSYTVVVTDDDAPTIGTCPPSRNINSNGNGAGDCTGEVPNMIPEVQANDNCSVQANLIITQTPPMGSVFGAQHNDTRVVTFSVKDPAGNISTCQNILTLKDNELPIFQTCPTTTVMVGTDPDQCSAKLNWAIPSAQDNCGTVTVTQTAGPLPGDIVQATCPPVPTIVSYVANDNNGNNGTVCTFEVLVRDLQKPIFKANVLMPGDITVECDAVPVNNVYHNNVLSPLVNNDVQDNCTPSADLVLNYNQVSTQGPDPMLCSYYNYTLTRTWTVTDCAANTLSHTQVITVQDTQKPTAVCKNITITLDDFGMNGYTPKDLDGGSTDNCAANANLTFTASQTTFDCAHLGANNITLTVTDPCGNFSTCVAVVTIVEGNGKCVAAYDAQGSDPCVCLNNATTLENGQFSELIQIHALAGQTWTLSANSGLYSVASPNPPAAPLLLPLGTVLTNGQFDGIDNNGNGQTDEQSERVYYTLRARHVEGIGYTATVTNGAQPITLSNKCYYPTPIFTNLDDPFCLNTPAFQIQVGENYGASGTVVSITVNGVATNIFDAAALGIGSYEVVVIFDAGPAQPFLVIDGVVIQGSDAAALADPGCQQKISQFVQVVGTPTSVICNDLVYVSLDADCTETLLPDDVLEGTYFCYDDYILELDKTLPLGNGPWGAPVVNASDIGHTYAYRITHAIIGNVCNGLIKVEDKLPPALKCPDDITVACSESTETQHTGNVLIEDCSPTNTVIDDVLTDFGECSIPRAKIVRTWIVNDAWNNQSTCSQTITITPFDFADLVFPANITVDCESSYGNPTALHPDVTGAPSINGFPIGSGGLCTASIGYTDQRLDICAGSYELLRTWVVRNTCLPLGPNNPVEHTQIIQVKDFGGPVFTCPPAVTVSTDPFQCCATAPLPDMIISEGCSQISDLQAKVTGTDPANGNIITFTVPGHLGDFAGNNYWNPDTLAIFPYTQCLPLGTYTVQYTAADQCGNTSLCSFELTVADLIQPTAACDQWTQVDLGGDGMALVNASTFDDGSKDNCAAVEFKVRRMQANDCQSDASFYDQVKFCCSDINDTIRVVFRVYDVDVPAGNVGLEDYEGHYNDCMVQVLVNDKIKPICVPPANTTVDCENFDPSLWAYGAASAQDNCCIDTITTSAAYTQFDTVCNRGTITRTFKAFDCGGLSSQCTQRVIVNYLQDYYVKFPNDAIVTSCDGTGIFGEPAFFGKDCELLGVTFEDQVFTVVPDACFKIERTWKIINWCTFNPNMPLTYVPNPNPNSSSTSVQNLPGPIVSYVNAQAPWAPTVVKINPTDAVATNYSVYWSANANGYEYNQVIKITDTQDPVAENCPDSLVTYCDVTPNDPLLWNESYWWDNLIGQHDLCEGPADLSITATDACSGASINIHYLLYLDLDQDGAMETVVNSLSTGVAGGLPWNTVYFDNINSPNFIGGTARSFDGRAVPANQKYGFALQTTVQGNKRIASVRWNTQQNQNTFVVPELPYGKHKIKWIIEDGCGNESFCEYNFEVKDCKKPSVVCLNGLSVNIMPNGMITLWASDFLKYTDDNCTPADKIKSGIRRSGAGTGFPVDGNGNPLTHVDFSCDDLGTQTVELWGLDLAGNADFCETYVIVQDNAGNCINDPNAAKVAGKLETDAGDGVQAGSVEISGSGNAIPSFSFATTSDSLGWYNFNGIPKSSNSTVTPLKDDNPLNGVSTFDLLLISKHILNTEPLNSPLKLIAADANHSGTVTTFDIVQLRKLVLGIYTDIPNNTSWRFIDKNYVFPNPLDPFETQFPETKLIADLQSNQVAENFIAIKVGDVNGSAIPNALVAADDRTVGSLLFDVTRPTQTSLPGREGEGTASGISSGDGVRVGEIFTVSLTPDQVVQGYQFTLNINGLEIVDIAGLKTENYAVFEDAVTFSVDGKDAMGTITLTLKARKSGKLSEMLSVSSRITKAEAYAQIPSATLHSLPSGEGRGGALNVALRFHVNGVSTVSGLGFELYQNQPNPFVDKTLIGFYLSESTSATLSIYDETGRLLYTHKAAFTSGYNHFVVVKSQLHAAGMMYYKVETETESATKKMLMEK